jgi:hypothetical protein
VHQLTEAEKESVSAEVKAAAKEMAKVRQFFCVGGATLCGSITHHVFPCARPWWWLVVVVAVNYLQKALEKKLKEIDMTEGDLQLYSNYLQAVSQQVPRVFHRVRVRCVCAVHHSSLFSFCLQVSQLRVILAAVDAKAKERQWLKLKTSGDLDDMYAFRSHTPTSPTTPPT